MICSKHRNYLICGSVSITVFMWGMPIMPMEKVLQQTRLQLVNANGDLEIDGEITGYNQYNEAVAADGYSSKVKLTMTVNVRYVNNTNHEEDFEQQFSAFQTYDSSLLLTDVQDDLISKMIKDITEQIFNSTVANW